MGGFKNGVLQKWRAPKKGGFKNGNEKLSVKMCLTKVIYWNQAKFGADAEKHVSDDAKKTLVEVTQLLESVLNNRVSQ